jgi:transcriptional repressor NF-X1
MQQVGCLRHTVHLCANNDIIRYFDCGVHFCSRFCHPPSPSPPPCPRSPSLVTQCPCGKQNLSSQNTSAFPPNTLLARRTCSDPIPTCNSMCMKPLVDCNHVCSSKCHTGPCPPCTIMLVRPCRCGAATKYVPCSTVIEGSHEDILCDRPCPVLRDCGKHQCNRVCCPLASLASGPKGKGKKRTGVADQAGISETGLHECDLVCGKMLVCGIIEECVHLASGAASRR